QTRQRFAKLLGFYRRGVAFSQFPGPRARRRGLWRAFYGAVKRSLAKSDLADAAPAQMRVDAFDDDRSRMLDLQREGALDAQDQGRQRRRRVRIAPRRSRPLHLD